MSRDPPVLYFNFQEWGWTVGLGHETRLWRVLSMWVPGSIWIGVVGRFHILLVPIAK